MVYIFKVSVLIVNGDLKDVDHVAFSSSFVLLPFGSAFLATSDYVLTSYLSSRVLWSELVTVFAVRFHDTATTVFFRRHWFKMIWINTFSVFA